MMPIVVFILLALCINSGRAYSPRRYVPRQRGQRPREQMRSTWNRQHIQKKRYGSSHYDNPYAQQPRRSEYSYQYGKGSSKGFGSASPLTTNEPLTPPIANTESTDSYGCTDTEEEAQDAEVTNTNEPVETFTSEPEKNETQNQEEEEHNDQYQPQIMNCLYNVCSESFMACLDDQQCKDFMVEWQTNQLLRPECITTMQSSTTNANEPNKVEQFEEYATFETTEIDDFDATSEDVELTASNTESTMTDGFENTFDETESEASYPASEIGDDQALNCEYTTLFWDVYNCGVDNNCYADQLKLSQSHQYLLSPLDAFRINTDSTDKNGSKSSINNWALLMVALTSGIAAVIVFEVFRRLYTVFQDKIRYECKCMALCNSMRYLKNKWEQIRGYKYEKTHYDLNVIEESDDGDMFGTRSGSEKDESIPDNKDTTGVTYNGPINDSDSSDDEELQKTSSAVIDNEEEQKDEEEQEIEEELVQDPEL